MEKISIKNHMYYYFDEIPKIEDFDFDSILLDEKSYENILIYYILYTTLIGAKPLQIRFYKIDEFSRVYDETRYLLLFGSEKYDAISNRIKYIINQKSGITYLFSHNFARIKIDSYDSLPLEKTVTFHHNVLINIKSVFNKDQNHYNS